MSYYPVGYRKPRGLGIYKAVFVEGHTLTGTYTDHVEVEISSAWLSKVIFALPQDTISGFDACATDYSGRAFKLKFRVVKDPATTSGAQSSFEALASGTSVSGVTINVLAFGE